MITSRAEWVLPVLQRSPHHAGHAPVTLDLRRRGRVLGARLVGRLEPVDGRELHVVLAEGRQHLVDVAQEDAVRPDDQHPLGAEPTPVRVEEVRGAVQRHRRLPRARGRRRRRGSPGWVPGWPRLARDWIVATMSPMRPVRSRSSAARSAPSPTTVNPDADGLGLVEHLVVDARRARGRLRGG